MNLNLKNENSGAQDYWGGSWYRGICLARGVIEKGELKRKTTERNEGEKKWEGRVLSLFIKNARTIEWIILEQVES